MDFSSLNPTYNTTSADCIVKQWVPNGFFLNKPFPIKVSAIKSPSNFHIQLLGPKFNERLMEIEGCMLYYYKKIEGEIFFETVEEFMKARYGAIFFQDTVHRVSFIRTLRNEFTNDIDDVLIYHCDHGPVHRIKWRYIMKLNPVFCYFPQQAIWASLANIVPINNELSWKIEANYYFYRLIQDKRIEARLTGVCKSKYKMHLLLNDISKPFGELNINEALIDAGFAEEEGA